MQRLTASNGRICLSLHWHFLGEDLQIMLEGGDSHIGAIALCHCDGETFFSFELPRHHEGLLVQSVARRMASALQITVCVSAGIHYQSITQSEIATVLSLADILTGECLEHLLIRNKE